MNQGCEMGIIGTLNHLVQESSSLVGSIRMEVPDTNPVDSNVWIGITITEQEDTELWEELRNHVSFEESISKQSFYVFEMNKQGYQQQLYDQGIRYGLIIPLYQQNEFMEVVFLGSSCTYSLDVLDHIHKKARMFLGFFKETTEIGKEMEPLNVRLKRYEQSTKALFEHNPDVMWWMDINGTILSANSRIEEITGYVKYHFINQTFDQFIHSHDLDAAITCFVMAKKGKPQNFEAAFAKKEGQYVELNITFVVAEKSLKSSEIALTSQREN